MGGDAHWQSSSSSSSSTVRLKPPAHCGHADELGDTSGVPTSFPKRKKKKCCRSPDTLEEGQRFIQRNAGAGYDVENLLTSLQWD